MELAVASGELAREGGRLVAQLVTSTLLSDLAVRDVFRRSWGQHCAAGALRGSAEREGEGFVLEMFVPAKCLSPRNISKGSNTASRKQLGGA